MQTPPFQPRNAHVLGCLGFIAALGLVPLGARLWAVAYALIVRGRNVEPHE